MTMTKEKVISEITNKKSAADNGQQFLHKLPKDIFDNKSSEVDNKSSEEFDTNIVSWDERYFMKQIGTLMSEEFTYERCMHALEVKRYLQEKGYKGFTVLVDGVEASVHSEIMNNEVMSSEAGQLDINQLLNANKNLLMQYQPTADFSTAIQGNDVAKIKALLSLYINTKSYSVEDVLLSILYAYQELPSLFEAYAISKFNKTIDNDEGSWDERYLLEQQSYLNANFAIERLLHLTNVLVSLNQKTAQSRLVVSEANKTNIKTEPKAATPVATPTIRQSQSQRQSQRQNDIVKKIFLIGGAVLAGLLILFKIVK
ncbi:hypothetical protein AB8Q18_08845 [Neisseriaceae bacterium CLB008]